MENKYKLPLSSYMKLSNKHELKHEWIMTDSEIFHLRQASSKDGERRQTENRRQESDAGTRLTIPMLGYCLQLGVGVLWRSAQLFD